MDRWQCKNTLDNIKSNKAPPDLSDPTTARPEHPKADNLKERSHKKQLYEDDRGPKTNGKNP